MANPRSLYIRLFRSQNDIVLSIVIPNTPTPTQIRLPRQAVKELSTLLWEGADDIKNHPQIERSMFLPQLIEVTP